MKKQTKPKDLDKEKKPTRVAVAMYDAVVVHTRRQKIIGGLALAGLFLCGFMLGNNTPNVKTKVLANNNVVVAEEETMPTPESERTCLTIENLLKERIVGLYEQDPNAHINNAKIYANLSERGCPENREHFINLAKQELQIARALQDDEFYSADETLDVVETYKRIDMQAAAEEFFEKAKRLTNPAIDFILQVEKIINE